MRPRSSSALWYGEGVIVGHPCHSSSTLRGALAARLCLPRSSSIWRSSPLTLASRWVPEPLEPVSRLSKAKRVRKARSIKARVEGSGTDLTRPTKPATKRTNFRPPKILPSKAKNKPRSRDSSQ